MSADDTPENTAITRARRAGFACAIGTVSCWAMAVGTIATMPPVTTGYVPADIALAVVLAVLMMGGMVLPVYGLGRY